MVAIAPVQYTADAKLCMPSRGEIAHARHSFEFNEFDPMKPTKDVGYTHVHRFSFGGLTPERHEHNGKRANELFYDSFKHLPGFSTLEVTVPFRSETKTTYEIVYVIERGGAHKPDPQFMRFQRDIMDIFRP